MIENRDWYTYRQAAARVRRHKRTIKKWRQKGLPMSWDNQGRRIVKHEHLLPWWRMAIERDHRNKNPHPTLFDI